MNRRGRHPRCRIFAAAILFSLFFPAVRADRLDTALEKLLGEPIAWGLIETNGQDTDPLLTHWVQQIGASVSRVAPRQDIAYRFAILGSDIANAFAAPGGRIFVTRGLLDFVESDDELAAVLAHESAHVSKRHATQQIGENLAVLGLTEVLLRKNRSRELRGAVLAANILRTLSRSRQMEAQADTEGLSYTVAAGYDPRGLLEFFERIGAGAKEPSGLAAWLDTHPSPGRRLQSAQQNPVVAQTDSPLRLLVAAGYADRGLFHAAALARAGERARLRPSSLPETPRAEEPPDPPDSDQPVRVMRRETDALLQETRRRLTGAYRAQRISGPLQQTLLLNLQLGDWRWLYVAARAYAVQASVADVYARTVRTLRIAPSVYDDLAVSASAAPGSDAVIASSIGRAEVKRAAQRLSGVAVPLNHAAQAAAAVLIDLNNPLYHPRGSTAWVRYGAVEALLRYAESELSRADAASGQAWRLLALARIRDYEILLNRLADYSAPQLRTLWYDLATRRIGAAFPSDGPAGGQMIQAALAVETGKPFARVGVGRGQTPWADWVVEQGGIPENIATVLRLLVLEIEREQQATAALCPAPEIEPWPDGCRRCIILLGRFSRSVS